MNTIVNTGISVRIIPVVQMAEYGYFIDVLTGEIYGYAGEPIPPTIFAVYESFEHARANVRYDTYTLDMDENTVLMTAGGYDA